MGGLGFVDPILLDMADGQPQARQTIYRMALIQYAVALRTGHLLAYNDHYVRQRIRNHVPDGGMPEINVRCVRCGAAANMRDWERIGPLDDPRRLELWTWIRQAKGEVPAQFLKACEGGLRANDLVELLGKLARGEY